MQCSGVQEREAGREHQEPKQGQFIGSPITAAAGAHTVPFLATQLELQLSLQD